jgi:hypothetical protein
MAWGQQVDELMAGAHANLEAATQVGGWQPVGPIAGLYAFLAPDGLSASRILNLRDFINPWPAGGVLVAVPTPDQLLAVPLNTNEAMHVIPILVNAAQAAAQAASNPLTDQLFWHDGTELLHIAVVHTASTVRLDPPQAFLDALESLTANAVVPSVGEA